MRPVAETVNAGAGRWLTSRATPEAGWPGDFIHEIPHDTLRARLAAAVDTGSTAGAIPLDELPPHLADDAAKADCELRLEAPLAVQTATRAGGRRRA